jgi:hypothetical protein
LVPRGTESPNATTDQTCGDIELVALEPTELALGELVNGRLVQPLTRSVMVKTATA